MKKSPLLLLVFNRPELTKKIINCLEYYKPQKIYVVADGPRVGNSLDDKLCAETRNLFSDLSWDCKIIKNFREENFGCKKSVSEGLTWFFENEEAGIILEDDIIVSPSFFEFCDQLIERYKDNENISMIAGTDFSKGTWRSPWSYGFSHYSNIWGWATWRRAWADYDVGLTSLDLDKDSLYKGLNFSPIEEQFWNNIFEQVRDGKIDTWDFQWVYTNFKKKRLSINPRGNLVSNIGFSNDATHTKLSNSPLSNLPRTEVQFPLIHPKVIKPDKKLISYSRRIFLGNSFRVRLRDFFRI